MGPSPSGERSAGRFGVDSIRATSCSDGLCRWSLFETRLFCASSPFPAAIGGVLVSLKGEATAQLVSGLSPPSTFVVGDEDMMI